MNYKYSNYQLVKIKLKHVLVTIKKYLKVKIGSMVLEILQILSMWKIKQLVKYCGKL